MTPVVLNFWWEWNCESPFWASNEAAYTQYGYGEISPTILGLPENIVEKLAQVGKWHDASLNWNYPPDPGPWRQAECDLFNKESKLLFQQCCAMLPSHITLIYKHCDINEDPDLDRYLIDPKNFKREVSKSWFSIFTQKIARYLTHRSG